MNEELKKRAEQNKASEKERIERIRALADKLNDELQERLGTSFFAGYINSKVIIGKKDIIVADIWHGFYHQTTDSVIISSLSIEEIDIIQQLCKLTK